MGEEDPRVDDGRIGQAGHDPAEGRRAVPVEEEAEDRPGRARAGRRLPADGEGRARPEPAFLDERPDARRGPPLEPSQGRRGGTAGDEHLGPPVAERRPHAGQSVAGRRAALADVPADEHEVERPVQVELESPPGPAVDHAPAGPLLEPARQRVVAGEVGDVGELVRPGDRDDVRRVPVVGECDPARAPRRVDERREVGPRREDRRARADDDDAGRLAPAPGPAIARLPTPSELVEEAREAPPEREAVGRPGDDADVLRAGGLEHLSVRRGELGPRPGDDPHERPGGGAGLRMEDDDGDGRHRPSLASGRDILAGPPRRVRAYIGLGANLGDPSVTLEAGVRALAALPGSRLAGVSRLYASEPVGVLDQPEFRNAVAALDVPAGTDPATGATALLVALKGLERAFGRRERERWGPRELDLDLLVFGRARLAIDRPPAARPLDADVDPGRAARLLVVPHPQAGERLFVLAPLADLAPRLVPPGWGETVESARRRRQAVEGPRSVVAVARWDAAARGWRPFERAR